MSIISDALKKVATERKDKVRLRQDELNRIFTTDAKKIESKKTRWGILSGIGTLLIVGFAVLAYLSNADFLRGPEAPQAIRVDSDSISPYSEPMEPTPVTCI